MIRFAALLVVLACPAAAQQIVITSPIDGSTTTLEDVPADDVRAHSADGVQLKGLDKISGQVSD